MSGLNELSAEIQQACDAAARRHRVSAAIDPHDWTFWFLYNLHGDARKTEAINNYFASGRRVSEVHMS